MTEKKEETAPTPSASESTEPLVQREISHIVETVENAAKATGVLAVAGYIALRAELNLLGISAMLPLGIERYLVSTWAFVIDTARRMTILTIALAIPAMGMTILFLIARRALRGRIPGPALSRVLVVSRPLRLWVCGLEPAAAFALVDVVLVLRFLRVRTPLTDLAVGSLCNGRLLAYRSELLYEGMILACALGYLLMRGESMFQPAAGRIRKAFRLLHRAMWLLLLLHIPIAYGVLVHAPVYPSITLDIKDRGVVNGYLVMQSDGQFVVWRAEQGRGFIEPISTESVRSVRIERTRNLLHVARFVRQQQCPPH